MRATYIKFVSQLLQLVFIFAHHSDYGASRENALYKSLSKSCAASCNDYMLIGKHHRLAECFDLFAQVYSKRLKHILAKEADKTDLEIVPQSQAPNQIVRTDVQHRDCILYVLHIGHSLHTHFNRSSDIVNYDCVVKTLGLVQSLSGQVQNVSDLD